MLHGAIAEIAEITSCRLSRSVVCQSYASRVRNVLDLLAKHRRMLAAIYILRTIVVDQPAGKGSNESAKMGGETSVGDRKPIYALRSALRGPKAAAQQARRGGQLGGKRRGRQEKMTEEKGRQR